MNTILIILVVAIVLREMSLIYFNWRGKKEREHDAKVQEQLSYYTKCLALERETFQKQLDKRDDVILDLQARLKLSQDKNSIVMRWDNLRCQTIIGCMQGMLANSRWDKVSENGYHKGNIVGNAISYADYLVEQLKKEEESKNGTD